MSSKMPSNLLNLPHEVLHNILVRVDPHDVARLSCSCRTLNNYIKNNRLLFKELYLSHFVSQLHALRLAVMGSLTAVSGRTQT